ncbi:OmpA family protein [Variovorax sp. YR216]|uniref:OmpA family protein n=1 Tax=Variovorax sp. YR216 TaxID=1882828 RepID=UPI000896894D|nr:OmpA family protein [Variovorax sp. YR216]SEB26339.1 OmpA family protein [Variovorax sp. YR216]
MKRTHQLSLIATALGLICGLTAASAQTTTATEGAVISTVAPEDAQSAQTTAYWKAKAQCWADLSQAEASQGDTHKTAEIAAGNARRIRESLQAGSEPGPDAERPIFSRKYVPSKDARYGRPRWRADIETVDAVLNRYKERACRTPRLGCLEVAQQSVYENMEETRGARWNHGRPEIDKALALASEAAAEVDAVCGPPKSLNGMEVSKLERPLETIELPSDTLFRFDQADTGGLLPGGREAVTALAGKVMGYGPRVGGLQVVGHTDRLGTASYNAALSQQRANTVADLLKGAGVTLPITATGVGANDPATGDACRAARPQQALIDCLQPDRRVVVRIMPAAR